MHRGEGIGRTEHVARDTNQRRKNFLIPGRDDGMGIRALFLLVLLGNLHVGRKLDQDLESRACTYGHDIIPI